MNKKKNIATNAIEKRINSKTLKGFRKESAFRVVAENEHFFNNAKAVIKYSDGFFEIKVICDKQLSQKTYDDFELIYKNKKIQFSKSDTVYEIDGNDVKSVTQTFTDPFIVKFSVNKFYKVDDEINQFYRLIIPVNSKPNFEPFEIHQLFVGGTIYYGLIKLQVKEQNFEVFYFKNEDLKEFYLVIDCKEKTSKVEFEEATRTILKTYSLFTGNLYQGELYFLRNKTFDDWWKYEIYKFENKKENIISNLQIVHPTKFKDYLKYLNKEEYADVVGLRVSAEKLSIVSDSLHENHKVERIINLLHEANKTNSLILRCSAYSVALETLSNIICNSKQNEAKPIQNDFLAEKILSNFKTIIKNHSDELSKNQTTILLKKIDNFNKPLNTDKLKLAFNVLELELNSNDIKALKARNVFLHGSTPFKSFEEDENKQKAFALFSNKMHLLLTCLLLRYLGFNGAITNHYAFGKSYHKEIVDEHFFRILKPKGGWR